MAYKQVNSGTIIGSIIERFNIDYGDFIPRTPNWIHKAMASMGIYESLIDDIVNGQIIDYKAAIPDECLLLNGITYLGLRLPRLDRINEGTTDDMSSLTHNDFKYQLTNNGYIITTFKSCDLGDIKFYIKKLATELDSTTKLYFPLIPDSEDLITALEWYILKRLLERGHKVGNFSLSVNNEYLNPGIAWDKYKKIAESAIRPIDPDEREQISRIHRSFLVNRNYYSNDALNTKSLI